MSLFVVFRLCRLYFDKLSRSTDYDPLIFDDPSTRMDMNQFKLLIKVIHDTKDCMVDFMSNRVAELHSESVSEDQERNYNLAILSDYYDSLVIRNYPRVYPEVMAEARQWLDLWNSLFLISVANLMGSPVCKWSWRERAVGDRLFKDEVFDDDEWQDQWEFANQQ
ncbi:hypothetical protein MJO29_003469 [Puccinia striiformis f. sp. tritici]|nr:hypothetical protein MJO29_003469 [Puccinia striiformis f. sp. tritici]